MQTTLYTYKQREGPISEERVAYQIVVDSRTCLLFAWIKKKSLKPLSPKIHNHFSFFLTKIRVDFKIIYFGHMLTQTRMICMCFFFNNSVTYSLTEIFLNPLFGPRVPQNEHSHRKSKIYLCTTTLLYI